MTRKAGTIPEETRDSILRSAEAEFAEFGYEKASLRHICANAGVTTGALYFFFKDKDDLFMSVIAPVVNRMEDILSDHYDAELLAEAPEDDVEIEEDFRFAEMFMDMCYQYDNIVQIIVSNLNHPLVKGFVDSIMEAIDAHSKELLTKIKAEVPIPIEEIYDDYILHWFSHLQFDAVIHMETHHPGGSREDVEKEMKKMIKFLRNGFFSLLTPGTRQKAVSHKK